MWKTKTFCTLEPRAFAMAAAGLSFVDMMIDATAFGKEVPTAQTVMPRKAIGIVGILA